MKDDNFQMLKSFRFVSMVILIFFATATVGKEIAFSQIEPFLVTPYYEEEPSISQGFHSGHRAYDYLMRYDTVLASEQGTLSKLSGPSRK